VLVSLVVSAALTAFGNYLNSVLPFGELILSLLNTVVSLVLISVLVAAIYKILPDRRWNGEMWPSERSLQDHFHDRKISYRLVYRQQRGGLKFWHGGRADRSSPVGLLFRADFLTRGGIHQSLCQSIGQQPEAIVAPVEH
jgi:hypothetical protein